MDKSNALKDLTKIVAVAVKQAEMFAYTTAPTIRNSIEWSGFRTLTNKLAAPFPTLRPALARLVICLDALHTDGLPLLPRDTPSRELFSASNPCHLRFRQLQEEHSRFASEVDRLLWKIV